MAREIGGKHVEARNLLPPGVDPHQFALSPRDISLVDSADLLITNGGGLDDFVTTALEKAPLRPNRRQVVVSEGIPRLDSPEAGHEHEGGDPHLWLDPVFAKRYARSIADAIVGELERRGDRSGAAAARTRALAFEKQLDSLNEEYRRELAPLHGRGFIAFHGAFGYLAQRYALNMAGVWQTTPGREPGPREVGDLLRMARRGTVKALLSEPQLSPRALEMIARDSRIPLVEVDPLETAANFSTTHYIPVMRANLRALVRALDR
jgi:ABC-type Zn uptake system ZnuABC Zn-binding protein ZnuA